MGVGILGSMFFFTYLPQAAVLAFFNGPLAAVSAALLVLSESSTIFMTLAKTLLVEDKLIDTFDGVCVTSRKLKQWTNMTLRLSSQEARQHSSPQTARSDLAETRSLASASSSPNPLPNSHQQHLFATSCIYLSTSSLLSVQCSLCWPRAERQVRVPIPGTSSSRA